MHYWLTALILITHVLHASNFDGGCALLEELADPVTDLYPTEVPKDPEEPLQPFFSQTALSKVFTPSSDIPVGSNQSIVVYGTHPKVSDLRRVAKLAISKQSLELLKNEGKVLTDLEQRLSKNLARLSFVFPSSSSSTQDGFLIFPRVDGVTLQEALKNGLLTPAEKEKVVIQLRSVVDAVHAEGYVHADLKPGNILLTPEDGIRLIDFGISVKQGSPHLGDGTAKYAAPEQQRGVTAIKEHDEKALSKVIEEIRQSPSDDPLHPHFIGPTRVPDADRVASSTGIFRSIKDWEHGGKRFQTTVQREEFQPIMDLFKPKFPMYRLNDFPNGEIQTVFTRIDDASGKALVKTEQHLVRYVDPLTGTRKNVLILDKVFTDLSDEQGFRFHSGLSNGEFAWLQALDCLLRERAEVPEKSIPSVDEVRGWQIVNLPTVLEMAGKPGPRSTAFQQTLLDKFIRRVLGKLGITVGVPKASWGEERNADSLTSLRASKGEPEFDIGVSLEGSVKYHNASDGTLRRLTNRKILEAYRNKHGKVPQVLVYFDVTYPVEK